MTVLGVDLGTSGVKVILLDPEKGTEPIAEATADYPLSHPAPGWSEQDPEDWWHGTARAIRSVLAKSGSPASAMEAVALSGQMHGATLVDKSGTVLRPCILWNDQRSAPQCAEILERIGLKTLLSWTGNTALAGFTAPKLMWVRENEPDVFVRTRRVLLPKDYINFRLTGEQATEPSDASGTLLFDVAHRRWSVEMLEALDFEPDLVPPVRESASIIGTVTAQASSVTGLPTGTPVIVGGADNACAALGVGVLNPGRVLASIGTSGTVLAPTSEPRIDQDGRLHSFCHALPDMWYLMGVVLSAGASLRWYRDTIGVPEVQEAERTGIDPYDVILAAASSVPAGAESLFFLPYLTGERTPHGDPNARGVFFGLSFRHTRAHLARSVVEGITFALADSASLVRNAGIRIDAVRASGGGSRSKFWMQMLADTMGARVATARADKGPAIGAAVLAATGAGMYASAREAMSHFVASEEYVHPDDEASATYRRLHEYFDSLYPSLAPRFASLPAIQRT